MKGKTYKFILMTLLPVLLLALSPMRVMVCTQKMEKCPPCCHEMSMKHSSSEAEVSLKDSCCIIHASEAFTAINPLQKIEDLSKKKFQILASLTPYLDPYTLQNSTKSDAVSFHPYAFSPHPPLILVKSSFLI